MPYRINPHLDEQNHYRCHFSEIEYMEKLDARGMLLHIDNVAIDVEHLILRTFQCDTGYCVRCARKDGEVQFKGSCCTDLEVDLTPVEIEQIRTLGRMAEERLTLKRADPLYDVVQRIKREKFIERTDKGEAALTHLGNGRCSLSWLENGVKLRCGLNTLCTRLDVPLGLYKPDPCFLFPLHYVEYKPDNFLLTILCSETQAAIGSDPYVGKLRCLSKPQPGTPPVYAALKYKIMLCIDEPFFNALEIAAQPYLERAGLLPQNLSNMPNVSAMPNSPATEARAL